MAKHFTPTHQRLYALLSDGMEHSRQELQALLWDNQSDETVVSHHVSNMRRILRQRSEDIVIFRHRHGSYTVVTYQLVRLLAQD